MASVWHTSGRTQKAKELLLNHLQDCEVQIARFSKDEKYTQHWKDEKAELQAAYYRLFGEIPTLLADRHRVYSVE